MKVAGKWANLYRAVDSAGETIEFMLSPKRDLIAAKLFLQLALSAGGPPPRAINVDGHPAYGSAVAELKLTGELGRRCRCRTAPYLNNINAEPRELALWYSVREPVQNEEWTPNWNIRGARFSGSLWCPFFDQTGEIWWISETLETRSVSAKWLGIS